jgi:hypothetical protein
MIKSGILLFLLILLVLSLASVFPVTAEFFERLPLWILYPIRICAGFFLAFMFIGYLIHSGILPRLFGKK